MPRTWLEALRFGGGISLLLVAAFFAAANPSARAFPPSFFIDPDPLPVIAGWDVETAVAQPTPNLTRRHPAQRANVDFAGWQLYLHSVTPEVSSFALSPTVEPVPGTARSTPKTWPVVPSAVILPTLTAYRPHAPPA